MSVVGGFPGLAISNRRTIRAPENPLDKSTVISIYPRDIREVKHTIQPGRFFIPAGSYAKPSLLVVGASSWWREIDEEQPLLEIPNSSIQVANSIVRDYCNGLIGCNMNDAMPGIFFIMGNLTLPEILNKPENKQKLDEAKKKQQKWYETLIIITDTLWARTNGNPLVVSDDARMAAKELNLNNKDWMKDFHMIEQVRCVACGSLRNPEFPVCAVCKAIADPVKAKELNIQFAQ